MFGLVCDCDPSAGPATALVPPLLQRIDELDLLALNLHLSVNHERPTPIASLANVFDACSRSATGQYRLFGAQDGADYDLTISITPKSLEVACLFGGHELACRRPTLLPATQELSRYMIECAGPKTVFGPGSELSARNIRYRRVRPPRRWKICGASSLFDVIDVRSHTAPESRGAIEKLRTATLPEGATREELGAVLIVRWLRDEEFASDEQIAQRLSNREAWLTAMIDMPPMPGWNNQGEAQADPMDARPHPPLTLYSPALAIGYQAIHSSAGEAAIATQLSTLASWLAVGKLDDGTALSDLIVIAETRERAHDIREHARSVGLRHVVYVGDDGHIWDPFPEGDWLDL